MKKFLAILILIFSLQTPSQADDIRDFQIEGISLGDSALKYVSETVLKRNEENWFNDNEYSISAGLRPSILNTYDTLQFAYFTNDKKYKLQGIEGIKFYRNNIDECNSKFDKIVLDIKEAFSNISVGKKDKMKHEYDKSGKSTYTYQELVFQNGDSIFLACEDWSIESGYGDSDCLRISLRKKNYSSFLTYKAYK